MNRINQFLYFAILILLVSCSENNPVQQEEPDVVSEIISELNFATGTSNQTISFTTNKKWEASLSSPQGDVSWCTLSPTNGNAGSVTINISVTENNGYDDRKALMTIITGNTEKNINIIQRQKDVIIVSKSNFEVSEEGGTIEVETNTNLDLEVIIPKEADWIHLVNTSTKALTSNKYIFNIDENIKATERQIIITFKDKKSNLSQYIEVKQHGRTKQTIHVEIPGTLSDFLQSGSSEIDSLIITGKIHGTDIGTIGGMANLTYLDLTNCDIVDGGEYRRGEYPYTTYSTKAGILPSFMFPERHPIQEILIPNSTIVIGAFALSGCENITSISIPVGVKTIDMCAFSGCKKLNSISIPNTVREIKSQAFISCESLTSIKIPNSVLSIGDMAFSYTGLTSIEIPNSVEVIGNNIFGGSLQLTKIKVAPDNVHFSDIDGVLTNKDQTLLIGFPNGKTQNYSIPNSIKEIGNRAFSLSSGLESIQLTGNITKIGEAAFAGCENLSFIDIPDNVEIIEAFAFNNCKGLKNIKLPNNITKIKTQTFLECKSLVSITIPNSVLEIEDEAFANCYNLSSITFYENIPYMKYETDVFYNCRNLVEVHIKATIPPNKYIFTMLRNGQRLYIPKGTKEAYQNSEYWKGFYAYIEE